MGLRIVADPKRARGRPVRQERRPSRLGLGAAHDRDPAGAGATDLSDVDGGLYTEITGTRARVR